MIQSNRFEKNEWFQKLSIPPPHRGFFPGSPPPLTLCQASYINLIFGPLRSPHPPGISNHFPGGSMDISWNYTMQKKTWPKNNCNENLSPLPNCYFFHLMGNSKKYPYPTTDGFHVLTPPCLQKFQNALPPPCPQNSIIATPPPPLQNFCIFFWKYIFDLATPMWTNAHEFMPPQGCDLAVPGDKLYSSVTRKTYH